MLSNRYRIATKKLCKYNKVLKIFSQIFLLVKVYVSESGKVVVEAEGQFTLRGVPTFIESLGRLFGEPAGDFDLILGKEPDPVLAGGVQVAIEGVFYANEREEGHRRGDAYVHPEHPGFDVPRNFLAAVPDSV